MVRPCDVNAMPSTTVTTPRVSPRQVAGEPMAKKLNKTKAMQARDSICRTVFNNIFLDIVLRCNLARQSASWSLRRPLLTP